MNLAQRAINSLTGKTVTVNIVARMNWTGAQLAAFNASRRWGGIDLHAQQGLTVPAHVTRDPTILYGERATGGEAFIPRRGNRRRSLGILNEAAGWYGQEIRPRGSGENRGGISISTQVSVQMHTGDVIGTGKLDRMMTETIGAVLEQHDRQLRRELVSR